MDNNRCFCARRRCTTRETLDGVFGRYLPLELNILVEHTEQLTLTFYSLALTSMVGSQDRHCYHDAIPLSARNFCSDPQYRPENESVENHDNRVLMSERTGCLCQYVLLSFLSFSLPWEWEGVSCVRCSIARYCEDDVASGQKLTDQSSTRQAPGKHI